VFRALAGCRAYSSGNQYSKITRTWRLADSAACWLGASAVCALAGKPQPQPAMQEDIAARTASKMAHANPTERAQRATLTA